MTRHITCISPVDGRVYVDRPTASEAEIEATLGLARAAQKAWRRVPLTERAALVVARRRRPQGDGRRDRGGTGLADGPPDPLRARRASRRRGARALHGRGRPDGARACRSDRHAARIRALCRARAGRPRLHHRALELPLSDDRELGRAGADRRQRRAAQAGRADPAGRRPVPEGVRRRRTAQGPVHPHCAGAWPDRSHHLGRPCRSCRLHRIGRGGPRDRARGGRNLHDARPRTRRQGSGLCRAGRQSEIRDRKSGRRRLLQFRAMLLRHRAHLRP